MSDGDNIPIDSRFHPSNDPRFEQVGICHLCRRKTSAFKCEAFPDGIPLRILVGKIDHTVPYPGDRGLQFVARVP